MALGALAIGLTALVGTGEYPIVDPDMWGELAMGRETLARGWPPLEDPFTYVPTLTPIVYHEWLTGVLYNLMLQHLGTWSFPALQVVLGLGATVLAALTARRSGSSLLSIGPVLFAAFPTIERTYSPLRAQLFSFFLFSLFILILEEADHGRPKLTWLLPPLGAIWANLHGGFVAGVLLISLYVVSCLATGRTSLSLCGPLAGTIFASLLNPWGVRYWLYLERALLMPRPRIREWSPVPLDLSSSMGFKALVVLALLTLLATPRRHWPRFVVLATTACLAFLHVRHISFFAIASVAYLPPHLTPLFDRVADALRARVSMRPRLATAVLVFALALLDLGAANHLRTGASWRLRVPASFYPVGAVEFIRINHLKGNLATPFDWGEYVIWKLYPQVRVSFDGRYETVYPDQVASDWFRFMDGREGWQKVLDEYHTDMALVDRRYGIAEVLSKDPNWMLVYQDDISAVYLPTTKRAGPWIFPPRSAEGTFP